MNKQLYQFPAAGRLVVGETVHANVSETVFNTARDNLVTATTSAGGPKRTVDVSWLPAAADTYQVSPNINDYLISQVPVITVDIPNRNLQGFAFDEVVFFDPLLGRQIYKTFIGKPVHYNHRNEDPTAAKGVIFDSYLLKIPQYNLYKIVLLTGVDRYKDSEIAQRILDSRKGGPRVGWSFGALVNNFVCSICGSVVNEKPFCACFSKGKGSTINGRLVYELCYSSNFIEVSVVDTPADATAWGDAL